METHKTNYQFFEESWNKVFKGDSLDHKNVKNPAKVFYKCSTKCKCTVDTGCKKKNKKK